MMISKKALTIMALMALSGLWVSCMFRQEAGIGSQEPLTIEVKNRMTPIKDQGESETCWIYAMLATIETEHLSWGDSVNLSAAYVEKMVERESKAPKSKRGVCATTIRLIQKYGVVGENAMPTIDTPIPRWVFMLGAEYTPQEFARSVCAPDEYIALTSQKDQPYYTMVDYPVEDNWAGERYLNVPMDSLLKRTERAVRQRHGVCWEDDDHGMAIVGLGYDSKGQRYFVMKNSWGTDQPHGGLVYISYDTFRQDTRAIEMTRKAWEGL